MQIPTLLIVIALADILQIWDLWGENVYRRTLHHLQSNFDYKKEPFVHIIRKGLTNNDIANLNNVIYEKPDGITNKSKFLSSLFGGHYSKKNTLYFDDFDNRSKKIMDYIGKKPIRKYEDITHSNLLLGNSSFRGSILMYSGKKSGFGYHYDTEEATCFRTIYLIRKEGVIPPFTYYNEAKELISLHLNVGDGVLFRGTTTFHGIPDMLDEDSIRYVAGWQYCTKDTVPEYSICSQLRGATILEILATFFPLLLLTHIMVRTHNKYNETDYDNIFKITAFVSLCNLIIYPYIAHSIGSGRTSTLAQLLSFLSFCLLPNITNYKDGLLLYNYIVITEMLTY